MLSRSRSAYATYEAHHGPNMTPMVDVVMVILIFFMASTVVLGPEWFITSGLPKKGAPTALAPEPEVRIRVVLTTAEGRAVASIDGSAPIPLDAAAAALRGRPLSASAAEATTLLIDADDTVPYADVVLLHEVAAQMGIRKIGIVPR